MTFQFLEEALRMYLVRCEGMTAARLHGITKYEIPTNQLGKMSFGRLVDRFAKFNGNEELVMRLRTIVVERNFIAHESYTASFGREGKPKEAAEIERLHERTAQAKTDAEKCMWDVLKETKQLEERFTQIQSKTTEPHSMEPG